MSNASKAAQLLRFSLAALALGGAAVGAGCSDAPPASSGNEGDEGSIRTARQGLLASPDLVISQVYGGGGNSGAVYTNDFIELFNRSAAPVSLNGKSIQYASATANFSAAANVVALPNVSVPAGGYYLIQLASGGATGVALPAPDLTPTGASSLALAKDKAKVALVDSASLLDACGATATPCTSGSWIDFVGYGGSAAVVSQFEGTPAGLTANASGVTRNGAGCQDTGDNGVDFQVQTPAAHNGATTVVDCTGFDAGVIVDSGTPDTGVVVDSGTIVDAAADAPLDLDSGTTTTDSGTTTKDAGTKKDAGGTTTDDAGGTASSSDAGTTKKDAGKGTSSSSSSSTDSSSGSSSGCAIGSGVLNDDRAGFAGSLATLGLALLALRRRR